MERIRPSCSIQRANTSKVHSAHLQQREPTVAAPVCEDAQVGGVAGAGVAGVAGQEPGDRHSLGELDRILVGHQLACGRGRDGPPCRPDRPRVGTQGSPVAQRRDYQPGRVGPKSSSIEASRAALWPARYRSPTATAFDGGGRHDAAARRSRRHAVRRPARRRHRHRWWCSSATLSREATRPRSERALPTALSDDGVPTHNHHAAVGLAALGATVASCTRRVPRPPRLGVVTFRAVRQVRLECARKRRTEPRRSGRRIPAARAKSSGSPRPPQRSTGARCRPSGTPRTFSKRRSWVPVSPAASSARATASVVRKLVPLPGRDRRPNRSPAGQNRAVANGPLCQSAVDDRGARAPAAAPRD